MTSGISAHQCYQWFRIQKEAMRMTLRRLLDGRRCAGEDGLRNGKESYGSHLNKLKDPGVSFDNLLPTGLSYFAWSLTTGQP